MCGRFTLRATPEAIQVHFALPTEPEKLAPRYNIAPTQPVAIVRTQNGAEDADARAWTHVRWGLIPSWAKDPSIGARMINARAETAAEKPSFRAAFKRRRCLVPADGFYEWKKEGGGKQPYHITIHKSDAPIVASDDGPTDANLFAIAGLWETWHDPDGSALESCTLLTTAANETMSALHHRMPVILHPDDYALWLTPSEEPDFLAELQHLLRPFDDEQIQFRPVSRFVNNARNEGEGCLEAV